MALGHVVGSYEAASAAGIPDAPIRASDDAYGIALACRIHVPAENAEQHGEVGPAVVAQIATEELKETHGDITKRPSSISPRLGNLAANSGL